MRPAAARLAALTLLLGACSRESAAPEFAGADAAADSLRFLVVGDFGAGGPQQLLVAAAMQQVCEQRGCDFVISTGDNVYDGGVYSVDDPQFELKFEIPYRDLPLPWYLSLGNHDVGDDPLSELDRGDYEVAYSSRTDRLSDKWHMPARHYELRQGPVSFFILDTNRVSADGITGTDDSTWATQQRPWLQSAIAASDATWKFAVGHHPYLSNGGHGNGPEPYRAALRDSICGVTDAFFAGHDHTLEWLEQAADCGGTELIVSGGGGQTPDLTEGERHDPTHYFAFNTYGFLYVELSGLTWTGTFYDENAAALFTRTVVKNR